LFSLPFAAAAALVGALLFSPPAERILAALSVFIIELASIGGTRDGTHEASLEAQAWKGGPKHIGSGRCIFCTGRRRIGNYPGSERTVPGPRTASRNRAR